MADKTYEMVFEYLQPMEIYFPNVTAADKDSAIETVKTELSKLGPLPEGLRLVDITERMPDSGYKSTNPAPKPERVSIFKRTEKDRA